jgi:hypothetical protein
MAALATLDDAEIVVGRTLTPEEEVRLTRLLDFASDRVRAYVGGPISRGEVTETCKVRPGGMIRLGQTPVVDVTSVVQSRTSTAVVWAWFGPNQLLLGLQGGVINYPEDVDDWSSGGLFPWYLPAYVDVTYTAGYDPVPPIVAAVTAQVAVRALTNTFGMQPNAVTPGATVPVGGVWIMNDEKAALDQACPRVPVGPIDLYGPMTPRPLQ